MARVGGVLRGAAVGSRRALAGGGQRAAKGCLGYRVWAAYRLEAQIHAVAAMTVEL